MERDQNAARTRRGLESRVDSGLSVGDICYGFTSSPTQERIQGGRVVPSHFKISIDSEQASVVNLIYDLHIKGLGQSAIAKELNRRQIPSTPRGQKITGKKINWSSSTIRKILTNPKYIGHWIWGRTKTIYNPITKKKERKAIPKDKWLAHLDSKDIRSDLVIVSLAKWNKVQDRFAESKRKYQESTDRTKTMRACKNVGSKGSTLLAGILRCDECGAPLLQITKKYYGCYTYHRKDPTKCSNKRMLNQNKIEQQITKVLTQTLSNRDVLESATTILNEKIKARLKIAPEELKSLDRKKIETKREIQNLLKFVTQHGNSSHTVKDSLSDKEAELSSIEQQILTLKSAQTDKLLLTPFALKEEFKRLTEHFESDPVMANAALRKMIPNGLLCRSEGNTTKKNLNQNNSKWRVTGEIAISCNYPSEAESTPLIKPNLIGMSTSF
jgi:site-specific DNA recombinase